MRLTILTAAALALGAAPAVLAQGDPEAGERAFRKCAACHQIGEGATNRVGPELTGVLGRPAASIEGFAYSPALTKAAEEGLVWDEEQVAEFLENPRRKMPGTKMAFPGIRNPQEISDVIAYLATFSEAEEPEGGDSDEPETEGAEPEEAGSDGAETPSDEPAETEATEG